MADTTRTQIPAEVNNLYSRTLVERATPLLLHNRWAQVRDIPANSGTDTIKFRKYGALTATTTALTEGVTPSGSQLSVTDITATISYYGDYVTLTDKVQWETYDPILTETAEILGEQAGDSIDQIVRDVMAATTTKQYASSASSTATVTSTMKINRDEVKQAVRTLQSNKAKPMTTIVNASTGFNTTPIGRAYIGIIDEDTLYDLDDAIGWISVEKYPSSALPDEVGALAGVRFFMTTNAKVRTAEGSGSIDVHSTLIFGQNAYAVSRIAGRALVNIVMPLGSAGTADPLKQRATSGWKATLAAKLLDVNNILDLQHAVSS